jgi:hypothetical protein
MRIHPINISNNDIAIETNKTISQVKPPQQHHRRNENAINEIMEDVSVPQMADVLPGINGQNKNDAPENSNNFVDDDDEDFMARIVDGTCRGIFSSSGNNEEDHDRPSLCHLPSCQLGENLNVLMVRLLFSLVR